MLAIRDYIYIYIYIYISCYPIWELDLFLRCVNNLCLFLSLGGDFIASYVKVFSA